MSRWDETNFGNNGYEKTIDHEEARLLKKFDDYRGIEKRELEKRNQPDNLLNEKGRSEKNYFQFLTIFQAIIIIGFTSFLIFFEFVNSDLMNLVFGAVVVILAGEIVIITMFLKKKTGLKDKKLIQHNTKSEFDFI